MSIESDLQRLKEWYWHEYPLCLFCGHRVRKHGDLAHLIRRSASREVMTLKLNTGLAHRACHSIMDDKPREAIYLPRFYECMYIIFLIDPQYYGQMVGTLYPDVWFPDMFAINLPPIQHHGELLTLQYHLTSQGLKHP
jgi:hypothetical protein